MSAFIDVINLIRLRVNIYHNARVCGNWTINAHSAGRTCFHMATQGNCMLEVPEHGKWQLSEGDLVIFPREIPHSMWSGEPLVGEQQHLPIAESQQISGTSMLCGEVFFQHCSSTPLLEALPAVFVMPCTAQTPWLRNLLPLLVDESLASNDKDNVILNRLCELLFSYALRYFIENGGCESGVLALYAHRQINTAIKAMHNNPSQQWQLQTLAKTAGMSRTQFSETFKKLSGWTVIQYLTWWRMQLAWSYLQAGIHTGNGVGASHAGNSVALVAEKVGYQSEAAFSRAFKKQFQQSAGAVRRGEQP